MSWLDSLFGGTGNVTGPAAPPVDGDLVAFDGTTGKLIKSYGSVAALGAALKPALVAHGNSGSAVTIDLSASLRHSVVVNANTTITFILPSGNADLATLGVTFSGGAHTVAYAVTGGSMQWAGGAAPTLTTDGKSQTITLRRNGTVLEGQATPPFS